MKHSHHKKKNKMDREDDVTKDLHVKKLQSELYTKSKINTELYFHLHKINTHERIHNRYKDHKMKLMKELKEKSRELEIKETEEHARADVDLHLILDNIMKEYGKRSKH